MKQEIIDEVTHLTFDSPQEAYDWLDSHTNGKMFGASFIKKDGERRNGVWIKAAAIKKDRAGGELKYSPREKGTYTVYEVIQGRPGDRWRMISLEGLRQLTIAGVSYEVRVLS
jgi:hypothetical protein